MGILQLSPSYGLATKTYTSNFNTNSNARLANSSSNRGVSFSRQRIRATATIPSSESEAAAPEEPPSVSLAFVHSVLLPDGTPDVHFRTTTGGQKLRDIMMDTNIELYGPYSKILSNCAGGGTCATCMVEVIQGKELLSPRTDKEKEKLKRNPKNWRLACQTKVGEPDSRGLVVIQQLPEWKSHEWTYKKELIDQEAL